MSKILDALKDVKDVRKNKYTVLMNNGQGMGTPLGPIEPVLPIADHNGHHETNGHHSVSAKFQGGYLPVLIMIIIVGVLFTLINYNILRELSKMRSTTSHLVLGMGTYETKLNQLQKGFNTLNVNYHDVKRDFSRQVKVLQADNQKILKEIDEVSIENNLLRVQMKELESTSQKLMDSYIGLNNEIRELRNSMTTAAEVIPQ